MTPIEKAEAYVSNLNEVLCKIWECEYKDQRHDYFELFYSKFRVKLFLKEKELLCLTVSEAPFQELCNFGFEYKVIKTWSSSRWYPKQINQYLFTIK